MARLLVIDDEAAMIAPLDDDVYTKGVRAALVPVLRNHPGSVSPLIKSNNLLNNALAAQEAYRRGAFEGIMRNYRNEISEGSISNIFVVRRAMSRALYTSPIPPAPMAARLPF